MAQSSRTRFLPLKPANSLLWGLVVLAFLPACFNSNQSSTSNVPGTGNAAIFLERAEWGRLVNVFDRDGLLVEEDVVVREGIQTDGVNFNLDLNPVTGSETLVILQPRGTPLFDFLFGSATTGLASIVAKGISDPPTFTRVARNGALRLEFSEFVDPASVNRLTVQALVGDPPLLTQEVRYVVKQGVGTDGKPKGIVILDPTISRFDQANLGLPENARGYPASFNQTDPNLLLRIPTELDPVFGQTQVLTNLGGNRSLGVTATDPTELSPSLKPVVVRAMRTGNAEDPFNGFVVDLRRPNLVGTQPVQVSIITSPVPSLRTFTYRITVPTCQTMSPKEGDIIELGENILLVSNVDDASDSSAYVVTGAVIEGDFVPGNYTGSPLIGQITTAYSLADAALQLCWVRFAPEPQSLPATGVNHFSSLTVRFNEPVDNSTVRGLDSMVLCSFEIDPNPTGNDSTRQFRGLVNGSPAQETVGEYIDRQIGFDKLGNGGRILFGPLGVSADSRGYTLTPSNGLSDSNGDGVLNLCLALRDGPNGILDLAGNPVGFNDFVAGNVGQATSIELAGASNTWPKDRYFALRANSLDEDLDGLAEYKGQFTLAPGVLRPRQPIRFSRQADSSNPFIGQRIQFGQGIITPLTPAGAVCMTVWRYIDLGLGLLAPSEYNLDVEGMNWSPFAARVFDDTFDAYALGLSHGNRFPDELINQQTGYPSHPQSGLRRGSDYDENILGWPTYDEQIVFQVNSYPISQVNMFTATSGNSMYPWPDFDTTYTWRDTAIPQSFLGGPLGEGVPPGVVGAPGPKVYRFGQLPSIALPLQGRFKCYPRGAFFRDNGFQVQIMSASSSLPAFRIFSSGGRNSGGVWTLVIPDDPTSGGTRPTGGFRTNNGNPTNNHGPELYWHQVDFVLRISRVFTHWFSLGGEVAGISSVTIEPGPEVQAPGTQIVVEFRGSIDINEVGCGAGEATPLTDAESPFDDYADFCCGCGAVTTPGDWTSDIQSLVAQGHRFFQIRITFVSNIEQSLAPEIDAFGFAWNVNP